jgi:addiction module HigA family antidote
MSVVALLLEGELVEAMACPSIGDVMDTATPARATSDEVLERFLGRVSRLVNAQESVTGDTAIRLAEAFGTSAEFWMRLQGDYELARAREARVT